MIVQKFGGSSVATPDRIRRVVQIVANASTRGPVAIVVSALGGATDALLDAAATAARGEAGWRRGLSDLALRHRDAATELALPEELKNLRLQQEAAFSELGDLLHGIELVREASARTRDSLSSYGERLSAPLVAAALRRHGLDARACDARELLVTDASFGQARVDIEQSYQRVRQHFESAASRAAGAPIQVVTGYIAATPQGETTTLGRGGSDYSASLLGAALAAEAVELWTDVDGVMSADPRLVGDARSLPHLTYPELMELSHFGAKVVYPPSVHPTRQAGVPLLIRNTLNPDFEGTRVTAEPPADTAPDGTPLPDACGISAIRSISLLRLEGDGMVGVPGIAMRLFGSLARREINVILISQASSEHSICFAVAPEAAQAAVDALDAEFQLEQQVGLIDPPLVETGLSVVAVVGARLRRHAGVAGKIFAVLGDNGVNVRAIAQGSSELNVSLVVSETRLKAALNALHRAFFTPRRCVEVALAGVGRVGAALLQQLTEQAPRLVQELGIELRLVALAGRAGVLRAAEGESLDFSTALGQLRQAASAGQPALDSLEDLRLSWTQDPRPGRVFVDCTASAAVAAEHATLLAAGVHVVTANKLRVAGSLADYRPLIWPRRQAPGPAAGRLYYEATVGAGLPVVRTLQDLRRTGDRIQRIEGLFSGTLSFLMDRLHSGLSFSAAVREAHEAGYTEPDPREDLSGRDVARKLLILARLAGFEIEPEAVAVEPLLPPDPWAAYSLDEFWQHLDSLDAEFEQRRVEAEAAGQRLCILGRLDADGATVELAAVASDHPAAAVRGSDNLIAFSTDRYDPSPLVVRGPGAGPAVTAGGVFSDLLRAAIEIRRETP